MFPRCAADLKPGNILLKEDPCTIGVVAKLTDFGLSTTVDPNATHLSNYTSGTKFYVAPEVRAGTVGMQLMG